MNPFRIIGTVLSCFLALSIFALACMAVGTFAYLAIVEGWWPTALKWIGGIAGFIAFSIAAHSWNDWEERWDAKHRASQAD
jgi:hypothetical protein